MFKVYENDYLIYDDGRVFSVKRDKFQSLRKHSNGYLRATIHGKDMYVHRLVAICFLDNPHNYKEVNHKDGNKANNTVDNLEWCTHSQNEKHKYDMGLISKDHFSKMANNEFHKIQAKKRRKYTPEEVKQIREYINNGKTDNFILKKVGGSKGAIYQIRTKKTYKDIM